MASEAPGAGAECQGLACKLPELCGRRAGLDPRAPGSRGNRQLHSSSTNSLAIAAAAAFAEAEQTRKRASRLRNSRRLAKSASTSGIDLDAHHGRWEYDFLLSKEVTRGDSIASLSKESSKMSTSTPADGRDDLSDGSIGTMTASVNMADVEAERDAFIAQVCSKSTRSDVRAGLSRVFEFAKSAEAASGSGANEAPARRHRRQRSGSSTSDDASVGASVTTFATFAAASSSAAATRSSRKQRSIAEGQSLVVNLDKDLRLLSRDERLRFYLCNTIPELTRHVNAHVRSRIKDVSQRLDEEDAFTFLDKARRRAVFPDRSNEVRWAHVRYKSLQREIEDSMPFWILEGCDTWDQASLRNKEPPVNETDPATRAARIDGDKLPSKIPLFETVKWSSSTEELLRKSAHFKLGVLS